MFIILTYDVGEKRVNKVRKILKKFLIWTQNSVFEGEISEGKLHKCLSEIEKRVKKEEDSIYIYRIENAKNMRKDILGVQKSFNEILL